MNLSKQLVSILEVEILIIFFSGFGLKVDRVKGVVAEGVKEIWLSSEDTGAYGKFFWL